MSALHFIGKVDRPEQSFMINEQQQQALTNVLQNSTKCYTANETCGTSGSLTRGGSPEETWYYRSIIRTY